MTNGVADGASSDTDTNDSKDISGRFVLRPRYQALQRLRAAARQGEDGDERTERPLEGPRQVERADEGADDDVFHDDRFTHIRIVLYTDVRRKH